MPHTSQFTDGYLAPSPGHQRLLTSWLCTHISDRFSSFECIWLYVLSLHFCGLFFLDNFNWCHDWYFHLKREMYSILQSSISSHGAVHSSTGCFIANASVKSKRILVVPSKSHHISEFIFIFKLAFMPSILQTAKQMDSSFSGPPKCVQIS